MQTIEFTPQEMARRVARFRDLERIDPQARAYFERAGFTFTASREARP